MKSKPRLLWVLILGLMLALAACGGEEGDDDAPTPPSQVTRTRTPIVGGGNTPTPLPTVQGFVTSTPVSTASGSRPTQIGAAPTSLPVPTSSFPNAIGLTSPVSGSTIRGNIAIFGSASHPQFVQYALEYGPDPNPSGLWYPITTVPVTSIVLNNALGVWNTTTVRDGTYQIRLHVWLSNGQQDFRTVTGIQVRNAQPTQPAPNNPPLLAPISNVKLIKGTSTTIALGMSDIDNDPLTYTAQVSNPSVATVTPSGASAITVNGVSAGTVTVFVTVSDGRGGSASQTFSVQVENPPTTNNPPSITPIASQTLTTGTSTTIAVTATDPDPGDTVSLKVASSDTNIVNASMNGASMVLTGANQGTASITVTATDSKGLSTNFSFSATVTNPAANNRPPAFNAIGNQTLDAGAVLDVEFTVTDPDSDPLTLSASSSNNGVASAIIGDNNTLRLTGVAEGNATITISASDGRGGTASTAFGVAVEAVEEPNNPPTISDIENQTLDVGEQVELTLEVDDPDDDLVSLAVSSSPEGIIVPSTDGLTTITLTGAAQGTAQVTVTASDGKDNTTKTFNVTVTQEVVEPPNNPPVISPIAPQNLLVGQSVDVFVVVSDPDGDSISIAATAADENIVSINTNGTDTINLTGAAAGTTQVTVIAGDGEGESQVTFDVIVTEPETNSPPSIDPIPDQVLEVGQTIDLPVTTSDANGDSVSITADSLDEGIVGASDNGTNNITLTGQSAGATQVRVTASDGTDSTEITFNVTVNEPFVNTPPTIDPIPDQVLDVGQALDIAVIASDIDGDAVTLSVVSGDSNIVAASTNGANSVSLLANAAGTTQVTVSATDGTDTSEITFNVSVNTVNTAPSIDGIGGQACDAGSNITVPIALSDPDGDTISVNATSDNPAVNVSADTSNVYIDCLTAGTANITVTVDDGNGGINSTSFSVSVNATNTAPTIDFIDNVTCDAGTSTTVGISYSDPEGNSVSVNPSSDNPGVANVTVVDPSTLGIDCIAEGTATIFVAVDDGNGGTNQVSFSVTVNAGQVPEPSFDVTTYPEIPGINANDLSGVYADGVNNQGKRNNVFSVAGDNPLNNDEFLDPLASGTYNLGNFGSLENIINFYNQQPAHDLLGDTATSFNVGSAAVGDDWTIEDLFNPSRAPDYCGGATPLDCELQQSRPSVLLVSFTANNAAATPVDVFRSTLQNVVNTAYAGGTIPVLATIPDDGSIDPATLAEYNQAIVEVATNSKAPLWNLYNAMQGTDINGVAGSGPTDFSDGALSGGYNSRNLSTLQILEAVKNALFP